MFCEPGSFHNLAQMSPAPHLLKWNNSFALFPDNNLFIFLVSVLFHCLYTCFPFGLQAPTRLQHFAFPVFSMLVIYN